MNAAPREFSLGVVAPSTIHPPIQAFSGFAVDIAETLRVTPAMAAGITTQLWEITDMVRVLEEWEAQRATS